MSAFNRIRLFPHVLLCAVILLGLSAGGSLAWAQPDITDASLPHSSDSVIFGWYNHFAPEHVSNDILSLYGGSWHSGDDRTGQLFPHWVQIDFGTPRIVTQLNLLVFSENYLSDLRLKDFRFEGSNDEIVYTPLHQGLCTYANIQVWQSFVFNNSLSYRYYRLYGLNNYWTTQNFGLNQMIIVEWEMFESDPVVESNDLPEDLSLSEAVPNPFNPSTMLTFTLPETGPVHLAVYDLTGRLVKELVRGLAAKGVNHVRFDGHELPSGLYVTVLQASGHTVQRKMLLLK